MATFHLQQSDRGQRVRRKAGANALQICVTNYPAELRDYFHEARKIVCNKLQGAVQEHVIELSFYAKQAVPLPRGRFLCCANVATDVDRINHFHVARHVAPAVASNVDASEHRFVAPNVAHLVASDVAWLLRRLLIQLLPLPLTPLLTGLSSRLLR
jgi:hypothetical protein